MGICWRRARLWWWDAQDAVRMAWLGLGCWRRGHDYRWKDELGDDPGNGTTYCGRCGQVFAYGEEGGEMSERVDLGAVMALAATAGQTMPTAQKEVERLEAELAGTRAEIADLLPVMDADDMTITNLSRDLAAANARAEKAETGLAAEREMSDGLVARYKAAIEDSQNERDVALVRLARMRDTLGGLFDDRYRLRTAMEGLLEGLAANTTGECEGISDQSWERRIRRARAALAGEGEA